MNQSPYIVTWGVKHSECNPASAFSAVHSDVSYAVPDLGYTWSETDTPDTSGKRAHLFLWRFSAYCPPSPQKIITPHVRSCCMWKRSMLVQLIQFDTCWPRMCSVDLMCEYMQYISQDMHVYMPPEVLSECGRGAWGMILVHVRVVYCEVIIVQKATVFTGLGFVVTDVWSIPTMKTCALPSDVPFTLTGFITSSSSSGSQAWYLRVWALVL